MILSDRAIHSYMNLITVTHIVNKDTVNPHISALLVSEIIRLESVSHERAIPDLLIKRDSNVFCR